MQSFHDVFVPIQCQAKDIAISPLVPKFSEIVIKIQKFSSTKFIQNIICKINISAILFRPQF